MVLAMLIQSLEKTFTVIQLRNSCEVTESYLCRDYGQQSPSDYLLVKIKNQTFAQRMVPALLEIKEGKTFLDFAESFTYENGLYAAFRYSSFPTLREKMEQESCSLRERMQIVLNLLEKMILYKMPLYFQQHLFDMDRVCVSPALDIGFRYELQDMGRYFEITQEVVIDSLWEFLEELFSQELEQHSSMELEVFINNIENFYGGLEDFYQEFVKLYKKLQGPIKPIAPTGKLFRMWEMLKRVAKLLQPVFAAAVLIAILVYLIFMFEKDKTSIDGAETFAYIGTREITE